LKVAIIGGTGCGGRAVAHTLRAAGHTVCTIARGQSPGPQPDVVCDRHDQPAFTQALHAFAPDAIVDQVAYSGADVAATLAALAPGTRYILVSSAIIYGPGGRAPYHESEAPQPAPGLPAAKYDAERALAEWPTHTCLRIGAIYGPGHAPMTPFGRDPTALTRLRDQAPLIIPEPDGDVLQPWYSGDHARLVLALLNDPTPPARLNAAGPETVSWGTWLSAWATAVDAPPPNLTALGPAALTEAAPAWMRPFIGALLHPTQLDLTLLRSRYPGIATTGVAEGTVEALG
jgi:nucleoside-diphosphate-sugar epimerase